MVYLSGNYLSPSTAFYKNEHFELSVVYGACKMSMKMLVYGDNYTTGKISKTLRTLRAQCPGVLSTKCFNQNNLPFAREVKNTEIGHLFEHLLLEYICQIKTKRGVLGVTHRGETWWNWSSDKKGTFHIEVDTGWVDRAYVVQALFSAIQLTGEVMQSNRRDRGRLA